MKARPITATEQAIIKAYREKAAVDKKAEEERQERLKGYLFWCSEGCGFVDEFHRCEQWTRITYIPPAAVDAILADERAMAEKEAEVKEYADAYTQLDEDNADVKAELAALKARCEGMREALLKYANHTSECDCRVETGCTCGLSAALASLPVEGRR